jgi:hypothetical protein
MLERLGRHREALVLYVHGLKDLNAAEAYCDRWVKYFLIYMKKDVCKTWG